MIAPKHTLRTLERRPEFSGLLREDHQFASGTGNGPDEAINGWFDRLMTQSGIQTAPTVWLGLCLLCSLAAGGGVLVLTERSFLSIAAGILGLAAPVLGAMILRARRRQKIMEQLPGMAEELARNAQSGLNIYKAFQFVAADTPAPLGHELRVSARRAEMGMDLASAVKDLPARTGVVTLTMLTSAISVYQDTGGDLISVLERLAGSVRDRLHFVSRLRAATIASRLGSIMMVSVPVLVIGFYLFRDPLYLDKLLSTFWGRLSLGLAIGLQVIGGFFVFRILGRSARF